MGGEGYPSPSWYVSREEIERGSPSRRDGVSAAKEAELRATYCSFIRDVCIRLQLPQITIATAIMLCHRFYLRQSHAKNEWQNIFRYGYQTLTLPDYVPLLGLVEGSVCHKNNTELCGSTDIFKTVATVCVFLASKMEDTPCSIKHVVIVAYETMYQKNPDAAKRIHQEEVFAKQKALILVGETLLLSTIRFDFNIQHPYEPLKFALKKLGIVQKELRQSAMSLINDTLPTTLVVQFKPHYIAAGSLCLAAKFHNFDLSQNEIIWWQVFDVALDPLKVVVQQMFLLFKKRAPCSMAPVIKPVPTSSAMDKHQIKPTPTPTPTPIDKHQIKQVPTPTPMYRHQIKPIPTLMNKQQSNLAPTPMDKQQMKPAPTPMDKQQLKLAAAPVPTDRRRIVSAPVPDLRQTQSSGRSFSNSNTEASSCVTTSSSFHKNSTGRSPRNEGNWYQGKNEENLYSRRRINHNLEHRLEERSNQRTQKSDLAYLVRSGPKDTNVTGIKNLTRQKRRIQEVGGLPTPVYMSDPNAWRQVSGVIVFETTSSRQKQKVERR